jgi:hypothetical protein
MITASRPAAGWSPIIPLIGPPKSECRKLSFFEQLASSASFSDSLISFDWKINCPPTPVYFISEECLRPDP